MSASWFAGPIADRGSTETEWGRAEDRIQAFRQPLVTATGIILGFMLNFAATWVETDSPPDDGLAYLVGLCVLIGAGCLIAALCHIRRMGYPFGDSGDVPYT